MSSTFVYCVALTMACGGSHARPRGHASVAPSATQSLAALPPPSGEYLPGDDALEYGRRAFGGHGRALVDGARVAADEPKCTQSPGVLLGGLQIPEYLGKGYLFWNKDEFYRSDTFTGPLVSAGQLPIKAEIIKASFGPKVIVFHLQPRGRFAWSPVTGQVAEMPAPGLIDIAPLGDGRFLQWSEPGILEISGSHGRSLVHGGPGIQRLETRAGHVEVSIANERYVLDDHQSLIPLHFDEDVRIGRNLIGKEYSRRLALASGVPLGGDRALMRVDDIFATIDLRTGTLLDVSEPLPVGDCKLFPVPNDILGVCADGRYVVSGLSRNQPHIERTFEIGPLFVGSGGYVIKAGACSPKTPDKRSTRFRNEPEVNVSLCIRNPNGQWEQLDVPEALLPNKNAITDIRWVPTSEGGAVGMVLGHQPGFYDTKTKHFSPSTFNEPHDYTLSLYPLDDVNDSFAVLPDGSIAGYLDDHSRRWLPDGTSHATHARLRALSSRGPNALGIDEDWELVQSTDYGVHWKAVPWPPHGSRISKLWCSHAGCIVSDWYRIGYPTSPAAHPPIASSKTHTASVQVPPIPLLECKSLPEPAPGTKMRVPPYLALVQALMQGAYWEATDLIASPVSYRQIFPNFDSGAASAYDQLELSDTTIYRIPDAWVDYGKLPILTEYPKPLDGLLVTTQKRGAAPVGAVISTQHGPRRRSPVPDWAHSVAEGRAKRLYALATPGEAGDYYPPELRALEPGQPEVLRLQTPIGLPVTHPDTIALDPEGNPGVLRLWSLLPPSKDDPALFLKEGSADHNLAAWSTLRMAPCEAQPGYRAIVRIKDWIRLALNGTQIRFEDLLALVHWNADSVCLESVAGTFSSSRQEDGILILSAEFGTQPTALVYKPAKGKQYVQPMSCVLK